ncbi:hypothetical protein KCG49_16170 [Winogradskyella sp. WHY3]|uniref:RHS repeat-associated core domain-containing protein n=1 Tax=Winogradskyella luteola TaxID=2828330 RepID=A0A9X1FD56_9FLAO|nr:hypothetical protein [Winogradskyella luteola]
MASKYKYNGIELEESLGLNLYEMPLRQYDPAIARWTAIDPVAHHSMSTYTAFDNNPVFWADPSGADSEEGIRLKIGGEWKTISSQAGIRIYTAPEDSTDPKKKKKKSQSKPVKEMSTGEFYGMAYNGAARTAFLNGNDPYNPTDADIAQNEKEKADAAIELVLFIAGEWAAVKVFQAGAWVYKLVKTKSIISNARWAQKTYSLTFNGGKYAGETIDDVVSLIKNGKATAKDLPIDVIVRDGNTLILNTRSSAALTKAGIPRNQWNVVNRTGQEFYENQLTNQLTRNKLTSSGTSTIRQSGTQNVIGN